MNHVQECSQIWKSTLSEKKANRHFRKRHWSLSLASLVLLTSGGGNERKSPEEFSTSPQVWCLARLQAPGFQGVQISVDREPLTLARWKSFIPFDTTPIQKVRQKPNETPKNMESMESSGGLWRHMEAYGGMGKWSRMSSQQPFGSSSFACFKLSSRPRSASAPKLCDVGVKHLRCRAKRLKRMKRWKESLENTGHHWTNSIRIFMAVEANLVTPCDTFGIGASFGLKPLVKTRIVRLCMDNSRSLWATHRRRIRVANPSAKQLRRQGVVRTNLNFKRS